VFKGVIAVNKLLEWNIEKELRFYFLTNESLLKGHLGIFVFQCQTNHLFC